MRCTLVAIGPRGDIQPMIALGAALRGAGAEVTLATHAAFTGTADAHGVPAVAVEGDAARFFGGAAGVAARDRLADGRAFRRFFDDYLSLFYERLLEQIAAACAGADLVVCWPWTRFATSLAEALGVPVVIACTYPVMHLPTAAFANPYQFHAGAAPVSARRTWRLALPAMQAGDGALNRWRRSALGLPPIGWRDDLRRLRRLPHLLAYSPAVLPRPADWPPGVHVTGYWFLDEARRWTPPAGLEDFLRDEGPPTVAIGFSSQATRTAAALTATIAEAVEEAGVKAVLLAGFGAVRATAAPRIAVADAVPHDWLFTRVAAVAHHGGSGTTGEALRAGRPAFAVPFGYDQPLWGARLHALGVGPPPLPAATLTVPALAAALRTVTRETAMRERAGRLAETIRREDGLGAAVGILRRLVDP